MAEITFINKLRENTSFLVSFHENTDYSYQKDNYL